MNKTLATLTLVVTLAFAAAPLVSGDFAGFASDQLPVPQIDPPIQPAGYAFAIWGPIYLWLVASAIYGYLRRPDDPEWDRARVPLCISLGAGIPWLIIAQISAVWASVTIVIMLGGALVALDRAPTVRRWWLRAPVALYAGWLTAATFVSLGVTLAGYGILLDGYGWAIVGVIGALAVTIATYARTPSPIYVGAVIWALVAICVTNGTTNFVVTSLAITGIVILLCVMAVWAPRNA
ncbi:hypothetical protein SAMN04488003_10530 [Loktanella fryxellensis]|uniref:TspO and MBR related proteins n=1 Tax=Loktanella fryxellensis TaxID=245187 RepID=A0A1H8BFW6_9RHOB|nr:hypothetical protein [Loktanella fryxellensis]SEM81672.1 hypothetical protein SAMN04488003_10530 [Loktanella fryxellensis]